MILNTVPAKLSKRGCRSLLSPSPLFSARLYRLDGRLPRGRVLHETVAQALRVLTGTEQRCDKALAQAVSGDRHREVRRAALLSVHTACGRHV